MLLGCAWGAHGIPSVFPVRFETLAAVILGNLQPIEDHFGCNNKSFVLYMEKIKSLVIFAQNFHLK